MGRFYKTADSPFVDYVFQPNTQLQTMLAQTQAETEASRTRLLENVGDAEINHLNFDAENKLVKKIQNDYTNQITDLSQRMYDNPDNFAEHMIELKNIKKNMHQDRTTGTWHAIEQRLNSLNEWKENNKKLSPALYEKLYNKHYGNLINESINNPNSIFQGRRGIDEMELIEKYRETFKNIKENKVEGIDKNGNYIISKEDIKPERVAGIASNIITSNPDYEAYMYQMGNFLGEPGYLDKKGNMVDMYSYYDKEGRKVSVNEYMRLPDEDRGPTGLNSSHPFYSKIAAIIDTYSYSDQSQRESKFALEHLKGRLKRKNASSTKKPKKPNTTNDLTILNLPEETINNEEVADKYKRWWGLWNRDIYNKPTNEKDKVEFSQLNEYFEPILLANADNIIKSFKKDPKDFPTEKEKMEEIRNILKEINEVEKDSNYGITNPYKKNNENNEDNKNDEDNKPSYTPLAKDDVGELGYVNNDLRKNIENVKNVLELNAQNKNNERLFYEEENMDKILEAYGEFYDDSLYDVNLDSENINAIFGDTNNNEVDENIKNAEKIMKKTEKINHIFENIDEIDNNPDSEILYHRNDDQELVIDHELKERIENTKKIMEKIKSDKLIKDENQMISAYGINPSEIAGEMNRAMTIEQIKKEIDNYDNNNQYGIVRRDKYDREYVNGKPIEKVESNNNKNNKNSIAIHRGITPAHFKDFTERLKIKETKKIIDNLIDTESIKILNKNVKIKTPYIGLDGDPKNANETSKQLINTLELASGSLVSFLKKGQQTFTTVQGNNKKNIGAINFISTDSDFPDYKNQTKPIDVMKAMTGTNTIQKLIEEDYVDAIATASDKGELTIEWTPTSKFLKIAEVRDDRRKDIKTFRTTYSGIKSNIFKDNTNPELIEMYQVLEHGKQFKHINNEINRMLETYRTDPKYFDKVYNKGLPIIIKEFDNLAINVKLTKDENDVLDNGFIVTGKNIHTNDIEEIEVDKERLKSSNMSTKRGLQYVLFNLTKMKVEEKDEDGNIIDILDFKALNSQRKKKKQNK